MRRQDAAVAIIDRRLVQALDVPLGLIQTLPNAHRILFSTAAGPNREELAAERVLWASAFP